MFDEAIYRFKLQRLQRKRAATVTHFRKEWEKLLKAKGSRDARDDLRSREQFDLDEWDEEINQLTTQHLVTLARNLIVPLPPYEDEKSWFESKMFGFRLLTSDGVKTLRAEIRAEKKAQWEFWQTRVTLALSVAATAISIFAFFRK
jgi:hypothetical protein